MIISSIVPFQPVHGEPMHYRSNTQDPHNQDTLPCGTHHKYSWHDTPYSPTQYKEHHKLPGKVRSSTGYTQSRRRHPGYSREPPDHYRKTASVKTSGPFVHSRLPPDYHGTTTSADPSDPLTMEAHGLPTTTSYSNSKST